MKQILFYTIILLVLISCGSSKRLVNKTEPSSYKHDANTIHPQFALFNSNDTITELHFKIASKELLYTRPDGINFSSNVIVSYRLLPNFDSREIIDSASVRVIDNGNSLDKYLIGVMKVKAKQKNSYCLKVTVTDLNKNVTVSNVLNIEKEPDL